MLPLISHVLAARLLGRLTCCLWCAAQVRFLARSFGVPGDHQGQMSVGYRWPYGAVAIVTPFNFPLEIPALQLMGALFMGNRPLLKVDHKVRSSPRSSLTTPQRAGTL